MSRMKRAQPYSMVLIEFEGIPYSDPGRNDLNIKANCHVIVDQQEMKRHLFAFVFDALREKWTRAIGAEKVDYIINDVNDV
jgi:hypothetical protein